MIDHKDGKKEEGSNSLPLTRRAVRILTDDPEVNPIHNFEFYSDTLVDLILSSEPKLTIGITGEWGTGKTTLMRMVQTKLKQPNTLVETKVLTVWFNAWRYEREDRYSLIALMKTIAYAMGEEERYKKIQPILLRGLGILGKDILRSLALRYVMSEKGMEEIEKKLLPKLDLLSKVDKETVYFEGLETIEKEMKDIVKTSKIVIFIDDLDRCSPKRAIEVLESIKVFLDIEGFFYVIGLSQDKLEQLIELAYKDIATGSEYLQKIIQLKMVIPSWEHDIGEFIEKILKDRLDKEYYEAITQNKDLILMCLQKNPRQIKQFINRYIISHENSFRVNNQSKYDEYLVLELLNVTWPTFYRLIGNRKFLSEIMKYMKKDDEDRNRELNSLRSRKDDHNKLLTPVEEYLVKLESDSLLWNFLKKASERRIFALDEEPMADLEKKVGAHQKSSSVVAYISEKKSNRGIRGKVHDLEGNPVANIIVAAYDSDTNNIGVVIDKDFLGGTTTDIDGRFRIDYYKDDFRLYVMPSLELTTDKGYLAVLDADNKFLSVYDGMGRYRRNEIDEENALWKGKIIDNITGIIEHDITVIRK